MLCHLAVRNAHAPRCVRDRRLPGQIGAREENLATGKSSRDFGVEPSPVVEKVNSRRSRFSFVQEPPCADGENVLELTSVVYEFGNESPVCSLALDDRERPGFEFFRVTKVEVKAAYRQTKLSGQYRQGGKSCPVFASFESLSLPFSLLCLPLFVAQPVSFQTLFERLLVLTFAGDADRFVSGVLHLPMTGEL